MRLLSDSPHAHIQSVLTSNFISLHLSSSVLLRRCSPDAPAVSGRARTESSQRAPRIQNGLIVDSSHTFLGASPPDDITSKKAVTAECLACLHNLHMIRTNTNRRFAINKKRNRPRASDRPAPQHNYNTRTRKKQKQNQKARSTNLKRKRPLTPPLQGPAIPGVNFPT